nr:RecName: Full=UPF0375 protein Y45F10B.15; Flags: Precursor [Caenorhabditis elegans]
MAPFPTVKFPSFPPFPTISTMFPPVTSSQSESWNHHSNCTELETSTSADAFCVPRGRCKKNSDCTVSEYYMKRVKTPTEPIDPSNEVPQCTMTPCAATEKISTDCETAFGSKLANITV